MTDSFETRLRDLTHGFTYPPTPQVTGMVLEKLRTQTAPPRFITLRLVRGLVVAIILIAGLMAVPPVRAAVLEFIQIGIVRIFPPQPTVEAPSTTVPGSSIPVTATLSVSAPSLFPFLAQVAGETTLQEARQQVAFPLPLPVYPADLGQPDRVFVQDVDGWMVVFVWLDSKNPGQVRMSLHMIEGGSWAVRKVEPVVIEETTVNGLRAVWAVGDYPLILSNGNVENTRLIKGYVLIWENNGITYRLETDLSMEEAVRVAESLQNPSP